LFNKINSVFSERYANKGDNRMRIMYFTDLPIMYHIKILISNVIPHSAPKTIDSVNAESLESAGDKSLDIDKIQFNNCFEISLESSNEKMKKKKTHKIRGTRNHILKYLKENRTPSNSFINPRKKSFILEIVFNIKCEQIINIFF
jgi:hypothetical protein